MPESSTAPRAASSHRRGAMDPSAPASCDLDGLARDITGALADLRLARRVSDGSVSLDTARAVEMAEWRLNRLLERRHDVLRR
jgi:hypothetical protein